MQDSVRSTGSLRCSISRNGITTPSEILYGSQEMLGYAFTSSVQLHADSEFGHRLGIDSTLLLIALLFGSAIDITTSAQPGLQLQTREIDLTLDMSRSG